MVSQICMRAMMVELTGESLGMKNCDMDSKSIAMIGLANLGMAKNLNEQVKNYNEDNGITIIKRVNDWMEESKKSPQPKKLFGELWFETELCILFADTNIGKSILATQIADSISRGIEIPGFELGVAKQPVIMVDCELNTKQFELRYSTCKDDGYCTNHYRWDDNFYRAELGTDTGDKNKSFEELLFSSIEQQIVDLNVKVVIVDNITFLSHETEKAKQAMPLMKLLKLIKKKYNVSLLVLAHTPKRDLTKPLDVNDVQGSKHIMNFCDSSFAIGNSKKEKNIRYIKQVKARNCEIVYDERNVAEFIIDKENNFLHFKLTGVGEERNHINEQLYSGKQKRRDKILDMYEQGMLQTEIAKELGVDKMIVCRALKTE